MSVKAWKLPWKGHMVPHAVLDVLRECNISCRACYNAPGPTAPKTVAEVRAELETLLRMRRLSSVSILGGEVTLHPDLCGLVRMARDKGLHVELITNGLHVDESTCRDLKDAGLTVIYFHIERGQERPDLPAAHTSADLSALRLEKATMAMRAGLDVGLTVTAYPGERYDVRDVVRLTLDTPGINYLLVTLFRDNAGITSLQGNILSGFSGTGTPPDAVTRQNGDELAAWMKNEFGFDPFGCMESNLDADDPRWLSYLVGTVHGADDACYAEHVRPSLLEKFSMLLYRLAGRYPMYLEQNADRFSKQLVLNGLLGGRRASNMALVKRAREPGARLSAKRLLFQNPAELTADGRVIHCKWCPDAILKGGTLVPVCIADHVS